MANSDQAEKLDAKFRDTIRAGVIHNFKIADEVSWKMMQCWLKEKVSDTEIDGAPQNELYRRSAESKFSDTSDLDLALVGMEKVDFKTLAELKYEFEESDLPFQVDILDWNSISEEFRSVIQEKFEII